MKPEGSRRRRLGGPSDARADDERGSLHSGEPSTLPTIFADDVGLEGFGSKEESVESGPAALVLGARFRIEIHGGGPTAGDQPAADEENESSHASILPL